MGDVELTRSLERGEIKDFRHASHLHVAWVYLTESSSMQQAANKMRDTLRRFAATAVNRKNITRPLHCFGYSFFLALTRPIAEDVWEISCVQIRICWKRIFRSLTIRQNGFSVTKREVYG